MIDEGKINEAENFLLEDMDYSNKENVAAAALFYQCLSEKSEEYLMEHGFSKEEVLDGMSRVMRKSGYEDALSIVGGTFVG